MGKSEAMKRYEAETGKKFSHMEKRAVEGDINCTMSTGYVAWLEAQLTWRPVSEKPEKAGVYFVEAKPYTGCESKTITTAYFDGESFLWHAVVRWLPIPPAPDTLPDRWEVK